MSIVFQSIRSGSSGNCLLVRAGHTRLLIDAGFSAQRGCKEALDGVLPEVDGVVVSHLHTDHISYSALRVMGECGVPVYVHKPDIPALRYKHFKGYDLDVQIHPFSERQFTIGEVVVRPFRVPHFGEFDTFGFELTCERRGKPVRMVVATDMAHWDGLLPRFVNARFLYVESNHDLELLRRYPNPNSEFHLRNEQCARLLRQALDNSDAPPAAVMLGHLSHERNEPRIALQTVHGILCDGGHDRVPIHVAPRFEPSEPVRVWG